MGDILSQSEIDELLIALTLEESLEDSEIKNIRKDVKEYDFARPPKFNKDHLRTLEIIFDNYGRKLATFLTGYLRTNVTLEVVNSEQVTYSEFSSTLLNPIILSIFELEPLNGTVVSELSASVGFAVIDRLLGGEGKPLEKLREFSDIEKTILKRFVEHLLNFLLEPWVNVAKIKPKLDKVETNSQFSQIISPNEMVALVTLKIKIGATEGFLTYCLPHLVLKPVMDRLNTKYWYNKPTKDEKDNYKEYIAENLDEANIKITANVGKTTITLDDFIQLQVNDVIPLDSYLGADIDVMVGNILKFKAKPGVYKQKNAIQITEAIRKDEIL